MVGIQGGSGGSGGFDYVQDPSPQEPQEGEEWFDTGSDRAFVFNGSAWVEMTIADHGQLAGVGASDHHSRYTDGEASDAAPVQSVNNVTGDVVLGATIPADPSTARYGHTTTGGDGQTSWSTQGQWYSIGNFNVDVTGRAFVRFSAEITENGDGGYTEVRIRWKLPDGSTTSGGFRANENEWRTISPSPVDVLDQTGEINVEVEMRQTNITGSGTLKYRNNEAQVALNGADVS